ncbi:MAG: DUF58 domain-containing protein, partial [Thiohalocapsa sp.]
ALRSMRRLPRHARVGEPCSYKVRLRNVGDRPSAAYDLIERLADPRPDRITFLNARAPIEARLSPVERLFGYPRWEWLVRQRRSAEPPNPVRLPPLAPGEAFDQSLDITPTRRGWLRLDALAVVRTDILGLMHRETLLEGRDAVLVLPKRYPIPPLPQPGHRRLQPGGVNLASAVGDSREFIGLRDYLPGDSPRHIHWAAWARSGEPVVKEYQDEFFSRQALILDSFVSQHGDRDAQGAEQNAGFECAVSVAASLIDPLTHAGGGQNALLDLMFVTDRARTLTGGRGLLSRAGRLEVLACLEPNRTGDFAELSNMVIGQIPRLSACIFVLLDWDRQRRELVRRLRARGLPLRVLLISEATAAVEATPAIGEPSPDIRVDPNDPASALARLGSHSATTNQTVPHS